MSSSLFYAGYFAFVLPFFAIAAVLLYYSVRRVRWKHRRNRRMPNPAFCPSSAALGTILLFAQFFYRPSVVHIAEARLQADVDEDDAGDPETAGRPLHRQLRQIRRGEPVERLVLRL
ncbi:MAG TPA: hypothetical protein VHX20_10920 [Terracidiphilus sp.]|jgi:hypothetical protein|nr:hypothetical protein [Terracidiphilus sp.]